jgi:hypothetical protein
MEDSVNTYLGKLSSEELERMADELDELLEHPGWVHLDRIIELQKKKILYQLVHGTPSRDAVVPAKAGGVVQGLEMFEQLIFSVRKKRKDVRARLLAESRGEG